MFEREDAQVWSLDHPDGYGQDKPSKRLHKLDRPENVALHANLIGHFMHELDVQSPARKEMATDEAFKDHEHWLPEELEQLADRGQTPLVYDVASTTINWLVGTERRSRMDWHILPRNKEGADAAEKKTELMKYIGDVNHSYMAYSRAFGDTANAGLAWLECGINDSGTDMPIFERYESWRNVFPDSTFTEMDGSDARYLFRAKWADVDMAMALWPKRKGVIQHATDAQYLLGQSLHPMGDDPMDSHEEATQQPGVLYSSGRSVYNRRRVRLIEAWFRVPMDVEVIKGGEFAGEIYDPESEGHRMQVEKELATIVPKRRMRMHCALMTTAGLLTLRTSPYRHDQFPFTPVIAYRRKKDGGFYGVMRALRDPQRDLNARAAKLLHILATKRAMVPKGSVDDLEELREEMARVDSVIEYDPTKGKPEVFTDMEQVSGHMNMMDVDIQMIQRVGGVTDENLGRTTNATSGRAIMAKQDQGALATAELFDNLRYARMKHGEKVMVLMEQYLTGKMDFRTVNERGKPTFHTVNDGMPQNSITAHKSNFIISLDDWRASMRQANTERLLGVLEQLAPAAPQIVTLILDLVVESMDIPKRDEIVSRIREATGVQDPDLDPESPEAQAAKQAKDAQAQMQQRAVLAEIEEKEARAKDLVARAAKTGAETDIAAAKVASEQLANMSAALTAAEMLLRDAGLGPVADQLLMEAKAAAAPPAPPQPMMPNPMAQPEPAAMPEQPQPPVEQML